MGGSELTIVGLHVRFTDFSMPYATSYLLIEASVPFKGSLCTLLLLSSLIWVTKRYFLWLITHSHRLLRVLFLGYLMWYLSCVRWVAHMIVKTLGSACPLLEIRWLEGRQASNVLRHTLSAYLFSWLHLIFFPDQGNLLKIKNKLG